MGEAVLGGGCFWCTEAAFKAVDGVEQVIPGYAGGDTENPSYREVCTGATGHAEVVKVVFDEDVVSYRDLLQILFEIHDPTTENQEGPDEGSQYRSIILYRDEEQKDVVEQFLEEQQEEYEEEIVTEVKPLETFYRAEEKHQDYFDKHPADPYCLMHARPKVDKAREYSRKE